MTDRPIPLSSFMLLTLLAACDGSSEPVGPSPMAATAAADGRFSVRNLGTLGGEHSAAFGINERSEVVGSSNLSSGELRAFLWRPGQGMRDLGTLGGAGGESVAQRINDLGEVVGVTDLRPDPLVIRAFLWTEATGMRNLGSLGGDFSGAGSINNRREVVGESSIRPGSDVIRAFLWRPGRGMRSLGTLGGANSRASDINDATQVVGSSQTTDGSEHAFLWTAARGMEDLGTLGGANSVAFGIAQTGEVVGESETAAGTHEVFLWTRGRGMRSLGTLGGPSGVGSVGNSVNTHRRVVGISLPEDLFDILGRRPILWTPERGLGRLPTLGGSFGEAYYLNEFGRIVGVTSTAGGASRATMWVPTAGPLLADAGDEEPAPEIASATEAPSAVRAVLCSRLRALGEWSRFGTAATKPCLAR